jgi:hypothetical protein
MNQDTGLFEAENPGTWTVTLKVNDATETTSVTIVPGKIDSIELVNQDANVTTDGTYQFEVIGFDADGNSIPVHTSWEVDNGKISGDGMFEPENEGTWNVTITVPGTALSIRTTIVVSRGAISKLILDPSVHVMKVNETQKFTVTAMDSIGNELPVAMADVTWDVSDPNAGFFDTNGVFTAKKAGKVTVTAAVSISAPTNDSNTSGPAENVFGSAEVTIIEDYDSLPPDGGPVEVEKEKDEGANMGLLILLIILIIIIVVLLLVFMRTKGAEEKEVPPRRKEREPEEPEEEEEWEEEPEEEPEPEPQEEPSGWEVVDEEEDEEYDEDLEDIDIEEEDEPEEKAVPAKGKMPIKGKMPKKGKMPEDDEDFWE